MQDDASTAGPGPFIREHPRERKRRRPDRSQPECATSCRAVKETLRKGDARASARAPELAKQRTRTAPRRLLETPGFGQAGREVATGWRADFGPGTPRPVYEWERPESVQPGRSASAGRDGRSQEGWCADFGSSTRVRDASEGVLWWPTGPRGFGRVGKGTLRKDNGRASARTTRAGGLPSIIEVGWDKPAGAVAFG